MNYFNSIASLVEAETLANFDELMQDQGFKELFDSLIGNANGIAVARELIDYAYSNLI